MSSKDSLRRQTASGIVWNFLELFLRRGVSAGTTLIFAWFLAPEDFGLVAMMAVFLALAHVIVDAGLSEALIRKATVSLSEYDTAFYANIVVSLIIYGVLFITAPLIASFYEEARLIDLIRVAGIAVIFSAFFVVQRAVISRELKFKLQLKVSFPAAFISGAIAVAMAFAGFGVWALIAQILIQALLNAIFYWRLSLWRPGLQCNWSDLRRLFSFGGYLLLNQMTTVPFKYMYLIVIAKLFAAPVAGLYFFAEKIRDLLVGQLAASIETVTYPALARLQTEPEKLKQGYRQVICVMTFLFFPVLIFIAAFAETLFNLFLPHDWLQSAVFLQLMCIAALLYPLHSTNLNILKVKGRSDLVFYLGLFKKVTAIAIFAVTFHYGIIAILLGQILSSVIAYLPNSFYSKKLIGYSVYEQLSDFLPGLLLSGMIGLSLWWLQQVLQWHQLSELLMLGSLAVIVYLLGAWLLKLRALDLAHDLLVNRFKGKPA